jgi:radical SAM superfamily enzyme YgiQ (UPF0313 family)
MVHDVKRATDAHDAQAGRYAEVMRVAMIAMHGFRVRRAEMLALGMTLPGLTDRAEALGGLPALGLLTLAGMTPEPWEVSYHEAPGVESGERFDANGKPVGAMATLVQAVVREKPTFVAISALTASVEDAYRLCEVLRGEMIATVIGGLHATACPQEAARFADAVVVGDGEATWASVLEDAQAGHMYGIYEPQAPFNLAQSPMPRYDLLGTKERPRFTVQTQRGCPLACDFCGASRMLGPFREKPAERVAAELREIVRVHGSKPVIELADDNTFAGKRPMGDLLQVLADSGARYFTEVDWRLGEKPDVLRDLAASGCVQVLVGFESMVHGHAGMGAKRADQARVLDACLAMQDAGVAVIGCFIVGSDGETHESMAALGELLSEIPLADVQVTMLTAFPGTALRTRLEREGRLISDRGWSSCTLFDATFVPDRMTVDELERGFRNVVAMAHGAGPAGQRAEIRRKVWGNRYGGRA